MKILITGHKGFIGRHVFDHFSKTNECIGIDIKDGNDLLTCDIPQCDRIIHLAARAGVRASFGDPDGYWNTNVVASKRLFEHAHRNNIHVIYASSSSAKQWYNNPYATTKFVMEQVAIGRTCGLRFHTVYGKDSRPDMMYSMLLHNQAKYVTQHMRDFTHVDDVVSAIDLVYNNNVCGIVDVGSGNPVSVIELAQRAGRNLPVKEVTGEAHVTCANPTLLKSLGWKPTKNVLDEMQNDLL